MARPPDVFQWNSLQPNWFGCLQRSFASQFGDLGTTGVD
jgi:hypothetical protein